MHGAAVRPAVPGINAAQAVDLGLLQPQASIVAPNLGCSGVMLDAFPATNVAPENSAQAAVSWPSATDRAGLDEHAAAAQTLETTSPFSVVNAPNTGGDLGLLVANLNPPSVFHAGCAVHSYTKPTSFSIDTQTSGTNFLYAPTTRFPSQCYEIGTSYASTGASYIYVFDFCNRTGAHGGTLSYVNKQPVGSYYNLGTNPSLLFNRTFPDGKVRPAYSFTVFVIGAEEYVEFDVPSGQVLGTFPDGSGPIAEPVSKFPRANTGWSVLETHFSTGTCPKLPQFASAGMRFISDANGRAVETIENYPAILAAVPNLGAGNACITNDHTPGTYYYSVAGTQPATIGQWLTTTHVSAQLPLALDLASAVICNPHASGGNDGCGGNSSNYINIDILNGVGPFVTKSTTGVVSTGTSPFYPGFSLNVTANGTQTGADTVVLTDQGTGQTVQLPVSVIGPGNDSTDNATSFYITDDGDVAYSFSCVGEKLGLSVSANTTLSPISLTSADSSIATVATTTTDGFGWFVTLRKPGSTYLTASAGGYTEYVPINAIIPPGGLDLPCSLSTT